LTTDRPGERGFLQGRNADPGTGELSTATLGFDDLLQRRRVPVDHVRVVQVESIRGRIDEDVGIGAGTLEKLVHEGGYRLLLLLRCLAVTVAGGEIVADAVFDPHRFP